MQIIYRLSSQEIRELVDEQVRAEARKRGLTREERVRRYGELLQSVFECDPSLKTAYALKS